MNADRIIGRQVHLHLFDRRMTKRTLANALGISEQSLGKKVNGVSTFTFDELLLTARVR